MLSPLKTTQWFFILITLSFLSLWALEESYFVPVNLEEKAKYSKNFKHFDYVNPNTPKGGTLVLSALGSFDSLNNFILKGEAASSLNYIYDTLLVDSGDESTIRYGLLAEKIFYDNKRERVIFQLRKDAVFHDGRPVTADDVVWTFNTLLTKAIPAYRFYYQGVKEVKKINRHRVEFIFKEKNLELPSILGQFPILPKHYWEKNDFTKTTLIPPVGSGPYKIKSISPGKFITYELNPNYWGRNLPVNRGRYNFKTIRVDYYRNQDIIREALKSGKIDFFRENTAKQWATTYNNVKAIENGWMIKEIVADNTPQGLQAFVFNTRLEIFKDVRVRKALNYAFDFEWSNKAFFFNSYIRSKSYFNNSDFSSRNLPSLEERKILNRFRGRIPEEVFNQSFDLPKTDGSGNNRKNLKIARDLLQEAGWVLKKGKLVHSQTNKEFKFEMILVLPAFERIVNPYVDNLEKLGISVKVLVLNPAEYIKRVNEFNFGMISGGFGQSDSPGNEQRQFWGSVAADQKGSKNTIGIKDPVIDELVEMVIAAKNRKELITTVKALDRVLLWNYYVIPAWYYPYYRVVYNSKIKQPKIKPKNTLGIDTWWIDVERERELAELF